MRASWICAFAAAALLGVHFNAAVFPAWTRGLALLSGGLAVAGVFLAAYSLGAEGWTNVRRWPAQTAFGFNVLLAIAFLFYALPG